MRLTNGEGWWLLRRRLGFTQIEFARRNNQISEETLRRYERDEGEVPSPGRCAPWTRLTPGEYCALARKRLGVDLATMARRRKVSRQTLIKIEADRTASTIKHARYWSRKYPERRAAGGIQIAAPSL